MASSGVEYLRRCHLAYRGCKAVMASLFCVEKAVAKVGVCPGLIEELQSLPLLSRFSVLHHRYFPDQGVLVLGGVAVAVVVLGVVVAVTRGCGGAWSGSGCDQRLRWCSEG